MKLTNISKITDINDKVIHSDLTSDDVTDNKSRYLHQSRESETKGHVIR